MHLYDHDSCTHIIRGVSRFAGVRALSAVSLVGALSVGCTVVQLPQDTDAGSTSTAATDWATTDTTSSSSSGGSDSAGETDGAGGPPADCDDSYATAMTILEVNCGKCHGPTGSSQGGFDYILDLNELIANGKLKPGLPESSPLFKRMIAGEMPPEGIETIPSDEEIAAVGQWIEWCAQPAACDDQEFIPTETVIQRMSDDINNTQAIPIETRRFIRYFNLTPLWNAGYCTEEIEIYRQSLSKLVNSLSFRNQVEQPVAIDENRLIYRIDIRDYAWDISPELDLTEKDFLRDDKGNVILDKDGQPFENIWELIVDRIPYSVIYQSSSAIELRDKAKTEVPFLSADAFINFASKPPLYHEALRLPLKRQKLEESFGINVAENNREEVKTDPDVVARAGFRKSDVSMNNRIIERHEFPDDGRRAYWLSRDFASNDGQGNFFVRPFDSESFGGFPDLVDEDLLFTEDGGEIIFNLPNGMQAYVLVEANGDRINTGPTNIVQDKNNPEDGVVINGISCMGCHTAGMIRAEDDVRWELDQGQTQPGDFDEPTKEQLRRLYPKHEDFNQLLDTDTDQFMLAVKASGVPVAGDEPILLTFWAFEKEIDLRRAASELGIREEELRNKLASLSKDLRDLSKPDAKIQREVFTANFEQTVCDLLLGKNKICPE